jgi:hypothetical protein
LRPLFELLRRPADIRFYQCLDRTRELTDAILTVVFL